MISLPIRRVFAPLGLMFVSLCGSAVRAQDIEGGASRLDLSGGGSQTISAPAKSPSVRYVTKTRTVTVTKKVLVTPTTGTLAVAAPSNAALLVEPINIRGGEGREGRIPSGESIFIFNDLKPGRYRVAAALEGYTAADEEVLVKVNNSTPVTLDLRPITYNVTFNTNVRAGEVRYAPVKVAADGKYVAAGETRLAQIQNGRAVLPNLRPGTYGVDIRSGEVGYQTLLATITLPGKTDFDVELKKVLSTKTFSATWTSLEGWEVPSGWRVEKRKLALKGAGIGLPRDESYRYYADFQLVSDVKMLNGVAASFVVHAEDAKNYYLVQLTGPNADEPYVLRGFIVKNGVAQRMGAPIPIDGFAATLKSGQFFKVSMRMTDNNLNVSITDSQTGEDFPLGILNDPNRNFRVGAIGIAVRDHEQNEINRFIICTSESADCPRG